MNTVGTITVAAWAQDKFKKNGPNNPSGMVLNRDYFVDNERLFKYIKKYGARPTDSTGMLHINIIYR